MNPEFSNNKQIIFQKAIRYCDQQDRCIVEVERKLREWGLGSDDTKEIIDRLVKEKSIDEQRFAISFVRGKFRIKNWGRMKIIASLYQHKIPASIVKEALRQIDEDEYLNTLRDIIEKKWKITGGANNARLHKTAVYAIGKGYESTLVFEVLDKIKKNNGNH